MVNDASLDQIRYSFPLVQLHIDIFRRIEILPVSLAAAGCEIKKYVIIKDGRIGGKSFEQDNIGCGITGFLPQFAGLRPPAALRRD